MRILAPPRPARHRPPESSKRAVLAWRALGRYQVPAMVGQAPPLRCDDREDGVGPVGCVRVVGPYGHRRERRAEGGQPEVVADEEPACLGCRHHVERAVHVRLVPESRRAPVIYKLPWAFAAFTPYQLATMKGITVTPEFVEPNLLSRHEVRRCSLCTPFVRVLVSIEMGADPKGLDPYGPAASQRTVPGLDGTA